MYVSGEKVAEYQESIQTAKTRVADLEAQGLDPDDHALDAQRCRSGKGINAMQGDARKVRRNSWRTHFQLVIL